jgi:DNA (cytosine-5)-methyltransferase 1
MKLKILNGYAGKGGNRELWGDEYQITAVELNPKIAAIYKKRFPNDEVIVGDAHDYILKHCHEYDIVWTSPCCPSHSRTNYFTQAIRKEQIYPDMKLWQEIIFLTHFYKGYFVVENVIPFYEPFLPNYQKIGRHLFWANFNIPNIPMPKNDIGTMMKKYVGTGKHAHDKNQIDRNAVDSNLGLHILNCLLKSKKEKQMKQGSLSF